MRSPRVVLGLPATGNRTQVIPGRSRDGRRYFASSLSRPTSLATGVITLDNGTLEMINTSTTAAGSMLNRRRTITLGAGGGTLNYFTVGGFSIVNPTSIVSGTGSHEDRRGSCYRFSAPSTYGGPTHVIGGTLRLRTNNNRQPITTAPTVELGRPSTWNIFLRP